MTWTDEALVYPISLGEWTPDMRRLIDACEPYGVTYMKHELRHWPSARGEVVFELWTRPPSTTGTGLSVSCQWEIRQTGGQVKIHTLKLRAGCVMLHPVRHCIVYVSENFRTKFDEVLADFELGVAKAAQWRE